ncbi:hypothetical protein VKT23_007558 [Stygiomarasmius scandens]|uniref:Uncharacterized protein n=1 Tax=Marasmiellus scandens TaxID=2682957 RepID=A0ABR1JNG5_9AGAR
MTWCAGRKTSKPPDLAYCLLGILGISMDPDYTESVQSAFRRLQNALVLSFPETFKIFEGAGSIYQILVRENARARVGVEQPYAIPEQNGPMPHVALGIHSNPGSLGPTPNTLPGTGSFSGAFIGRGMPDYSESSMKDLARLPGHSGPFNPSPHVMGNYYSEPLIAPDKKAFVTSMLTPQNNGDYLSPGIKFSQNSPQNPWLSQYPPSSWQLQHAGPVMYSQPPMASGPYRPNTSSSKRSYPLPDNPIPFVPTR